MSLKLSIALLLVFAACLFCSEIDQVVNLNDVAEPVFDEVRKRMVESKLDKVPVSDMAENYKVGIFGYQFKLLQFRCSNGWVGDMSSLTRAGDFVMYPVGNSMALDLPFRFTDLHYNCDSYFLKLPIMNFDGRLNAKVGYNQLDLKVRIEFVNEECTYRIDRFQIKHLEDIKIQMTGFSILNGLVNKLVTNVAGKFRSAIGSRFVNELKEALVNNVEEAKLCRRNETSNYVY